MYHRIQIDILSKENTIELFLAEVEEILANPKNDPIILTTFIIPGVRIFDSNLPIFYFYNAKNTIHDKDKFKQFSIYLKDRYIKVPQIKNSYLNKKGFIVDSYILTLDYIIINKSYFDSLLIGDVENIKELKSLEKDYKDFILNAYAEFMLNMNISKLFDSQKEFNLKSLEFFEENIMTKYELLKIYTQKYGFSSHMKYDITGSVGEIQFLNLYL